MDRYRLIMKAKRIFFLLPVLAFKFSLGQYIDGKIDTARTSLDSAESEKAKTTVNNFINTILQEGNVDSIFTMCSLPFVMDGDLYVDAQKAKAQFLVMIKEVNTHSEKMIIDTSYIFGVRKEILHRVIPLNVYFVISTLKFKMNGQITSKRSVFAVQVSDRPKITGISGID